MCKIARIQGPKFLFFFVRIAVLIVIIISIRAVFFENMTSFTLILNEELEQGNLKTTLDSWK